MRLGTLNRLKLVAVSSAVVTSLIANSGCKVNKPAPAQPKPLAMPMAQPVKKPATQPSVHSKIAAATKPTTLPSTMASTMPVVNPPITPVIPLPLHPASQPATAPASQPTTAPATQAATEPTSQPVVPPIADEPAPTDTATIQSDAALAERLAGVAELEFTTKVDQKEAWYWIWKHQASLLTACGTLDPSESRFPRLTADALAQIHDSDGESEALRLAIIARPTDEMSWNRRLDLFLAKMQTADGKLKYLADVMGNADIPPDVRAHAGFLRTQTLLDRGEDDSAKAILAEALRDCPSSLECLTLRYNMLPESTPVYERCGQLLDLLKANPLQPRYSSELANLVAESGLLSESLQWFDLAVGTAHQQGAPAKNTMLNWGAALYVTDQKLEALRLNSNLLQIDPGYTPAYFLQLVITRTMGDQDAFTKTLKQAANALSNRVVDTINAAAPKEATKATTRPLTDQSPLELPDLGLTVAQLNKTGTPEMKQQFAQAVSDLAMLEGYFDQQPEAAEKMVDALQAILPDNSPEVARLRGWNDLLAKKTDDAKSKFVSAAAQDPLAELGLVQIMLASPADRSKAESMGRRLIQDHPSGLIGAILWEQLHNARVKLVTTTQADALREQLNQFPAEMLTVAEKPQNFYAVHVQPALVGSFPGEPLLAQISIQNLSGSDLTIGPDGVLKPELLFTVTPLQGDKKPSFTAFDTLAGPLVLGTHSRLDQIVRIDQTQLLAYLNTQSGQAFEITGTLATNQTARRLGGYPVQFFKTFYRKAAPLNPQNEQAALTDLSSGRPEQKITALSLLELFVQDLQQMKPPGEHTPEEIRALIGAIHHARLDTLPAVSAWAAKCEFDLIGDHDRSLIVSDLSQDNDWRHRQIALLLANNVDKETRDDVLAKLTIDTQGSVRSDALALQGFVALPPKTPTTAP